MDFQVRQKSLVTEEVLELFKPQEGLVTFYYGRIRNGKSTSASLDILDLLKQGEVVYANWAVNFEGYDQRSSFVVALMKFLTGRKYYFNYDKSNFHFFKPDDIDISFLGNLVGVHIFIDEGQWIFNSQMRQHDPEKRKLILHNGHYCRSLNIVSQRPINIFKDMRSQVNIWYKCEKLFSFGKYILFRRTQYEDMVDDVPNEEEPSGRPKFYIVDRSKPPLFDTHAMRSAGARIENSKFDVYTSTGWERFKHLLTFAVPTRVMKAVSTRRVRALPAPPKPPLPQIIRKVPVIRGNTIDLRG